MSLPAFSVVVPLFNKALHIEATLRSVLNQSLPPHEIVVIDDGSTDAGADVVQALGDPRVKLIRQANGGVARARNTGIREASGNWIVFLDADDWQHPQFLRGLAALMAQYPVADMVAAQYRSIPVDRFAQPEPWPVDLQAPTELINDLPCRWLKGATFFTSSIAVRSSRLQAQEHCFPPGESFGEDLDLWFRLGEQTPIALHSAPLVARVWMPDSLSVRHVARTEPPYLCRMEARALTGQMSGALSQSTLRLVNHHRLTLARQAITAGERKLALQLLWRGRRGGLTRRWWATALMATLAPSGLVHRWQHWRKRRKMVLG